MYQQNLCDKLNNTISKLTAVSDFVKRIGDESYLLEEQTPLGLHLFMGNCIEDLKDVEQCLERA